jgi:DNA-binding phage protein
MKMTSIAEKSGIVRETLYNRLSGIGDFTATEIVGLTDTLRLSKAEREQIFFQ